MNSEFEYLCEKCWRLGELLEKQRENKLTHEKWLAVVRLLINAGRIDLARKFTAQTSERNYERENEIDELSLCKYERDVLCSELGCNESDIRATEANGIAVCFGDDVWLDEKNNIINSPAYEIALTQDEKKTIGLIYKKNEKTNKYVFKRMNPIIYAEYIFENYRLMFHDSGQYYIYSGHYWKLLSDFKMKKALLGFFDKFEPNRWRTAIQSTYMSALRYKCYDIDELKSAENYINVKNGLLDISGETIKLVPHNEKIFSTVQIPIDYDKKAKCPRFKEFMRDVFQKSGNLIRLVQEIMGYCLSNSVKAHKIFIFHGAGSNGKSVLCEVMTALAGGVENVSNVPLKDLGKKFSLAQIVDKTLNIATENETDAPLDTQMLKMIASGDSIQMEAKFQAPYSYKPYTKLVFAMNNLPYVKDKSYGFERRLIIIPFNMRFVDREPRSEKEARVDRNLADTLIKNELEGIFAFAMRGLERLKKNDFGFTESRKAERKLEEYKERIDTYLEFVRQLVTENPNAEPVNVTTLWHYYKKWCDDEGYQNAKKVAQKTFGEAIRRVFEDEGILYDKRKNNKWFLHGIVVQGLNDIPQEEENDEEEIKSLDDLHDF